jgi:site-specific DNA recombinase
VWNKQRTDEILLDVEDVAPGHVAKMRWNPNDKWIWSEQMVHQPLVTMEEFEQVQQIMAARSHSPVLHKPHRSKHEYALRGCVFCGVCHRRMEGLWANRAPCYRCRFPEQYAIANKIDHPKNITIRKDAILPRLDVTGGAEMQALAGCSVWRPPAWVRSSASGRRVRGFRRRSW